MRGRQLVLSAISIFLFLVPVSAFADSIEITPQIGYRYGGIVRVLNDEVSEVSLDSGLAYGLTVGFLFTESMGFEFAWNRQHSGVEAEEARVANINVDRYLGNFTYEWGKQPNRMRPFVFVGLGASRLIPKGFAPLTKFAAAAGGGLKLFYNEQLGFRFQAIYTRTFIDSEPVTLLCDPVYGCFTIADSINMNQFEIGTGVIFRF
jgi:hypothetical protein